MRAYDIILKKRRGMELSREEIRFLIQGYTEGNIPDYQMAAWAMAVFFQGMEDSEIAELTMAMAESGDQVDLSPIEGIKVDKHSTGGVGDKTTLIIAPLVAAAGVPVAKMSGRGLGHTGGTIDKLEAIPGFNVTLSRQDFIKNVNQVKACVVGQTGNLAPADKKLYALRDVTATVDSIPLIASSVMSKKLAAGAEAIVLDVKTGSGAFMRQEEDAFKLAQTMVDIGTNVGRRTVAVISDMDQPLGKAVGNALEVLEAIQTLKGQGPRDLLEVTLVLGAHMVVLAGKAPDFDAARRLLEEILADGRGLSKFKEIISAQGGDAGVVENPELLPRAAHVLSVKSPQDGYVQRIHAEMVGNTAAALGAGRETKESVIDLAVGLVLEKKVGDQVKAGEILATIHANDPVKGDQAVQNLLTAYTLGENRPGERKLIYGTVE